MKIASLMRRDRVLTVQAPFMQVWLDWLSENLSSAINCKSIRGVELSVLDILQVVPWELILLLSSMSA